MSEWPSNMRTAPIRTWPGALTPAATRKWARFDSTLGSTLSLMDRELRMIGGRDVELLVAIAPEQFRLDGQPRAQAKAEHPGVILSLNSRHGHLSYPCDTFTTWQDNLRAIALALEALRKVDRFGVTSHGEQYRGFLALEATSGDTALPFTDADSAAVWLNSEFGTPGVINTFRYLVNAGKRATHPDHGGDAARFPLVMRAEGLMREAGRL